jgi:hypothetical protein
MSALQWHFLTPLSLLMGALFVNGMVFEVPAGYTSFNAKDEARAIIPLPKFLNNIQTISAIE